MNYPKIIQDIDSLSEYSKSRPYLFRTKLERILNRIIAISKCDSKTSTLLLASELKEKFKCLSDHSNQSSDGSLKSYCFIEDDLKRLRNNILTLNQLM